MKEIPYEEYCKQVRLRDGLVCSRDCGRGTQDQHFRVLRVNPLKADSIRNLETLCIWCARESDWE